MALALHDIVEVSFRGTLFGQRILNILHYVVNVTASGTTEAQLLRLAQDLVQGTGNPAGLETHWLDCFGVEYTLDEIRAQRVYPDRTIYQKFAANDVGTHASPMVSSNQATSLEKRTLTVGRKGIGRIQVVGPPQGEFANGVVGAVYLAGPIATLITDLKSSYTTSVGPVTYVPCLYNPTGAPDKYSVLFDIVPQDTLRTMHRRTVRLGE